MAHTKTDPKRYDCWANAKEDEPVFVLLARDPVAWLLVMQWAGIRQALGKTAPEQIADAEECAREMATYCDSIGKSVDRTIAHTAFFELYRQWQADDKLRASQRELNATRGLLQEEHSKLGLAQLELDAVRQLVVGSVAEVQELTKNEAYKTSVAFDAVLGLRSQVESVIVAASGGVEQLKALEASPSLTANDAVQEVLSLRRAVTSQRARIEELEAKVAAAGRPMNVAPEDGSPS